MCALWTTCIELGLYKEPGKVLANGVLSAGKDVSTRFKSFAAKLHAYGVQGLDATLFRPRDVRPTSETDLLHLLSKGALYAREYRSLAPLFPLLFDAVDIFPKEAIANLVDAF